MSRRGYKKSKPGEYILHPGWTMPTKPCKNGHLVPRVTNGACAQCVREYRKLKNHYAQNETAWRNENRIKLAEQARDYWNRNPEKRMLNAARKTAKNKNLPFNIDLNDINIPEFCPVLKIKLEKTEGARTSHSPSLDRIIPELGYTKGNVMVISWRANRIKSDATLEEMKALLTFYEPILSEKLP